MPEIAHLLVGKVPSDPRPYPHGVKLTIPDTGFGVQMDAMLAFLKDHGLIYRRRNAKRGTPEYGKAVTWLFPEEQMARDFAARFGGEYVGSR